MPFDIDPHLFFVLVMLFYSSGIRIPVLFYTYGRPIEARLTAKPHETIV